MMSLMMWLRITISRVGEKVETERGTSMLLELV